MSDLRSLDLFMDTIDTVTNATQRNERESAHLFSEHRIPTTLLSRVHVSPVHTGTHICHRPLRMSIYKTSMLATSHTNTLLVRDSFLNDY
jgi:hypothetical protein